MVVVQVVVQITLLVLQAQPMVRVAVAAEIVQLQVYKLAVLAHKA